MSHPMDWFCRGCGRPVDAPGEPCDCGGKRRPASPNRKLRAEYDACDAAVIIAACEHLDRAGQERVMAAVAITRSIKR